MDLLLGIAIGSTVGIAVTWALMRERSTAATASVRAELQPELSVLQAQNSANKEELTKNARDRQVLEERLVALDKERDLLAENKAAADALLPRIPILEQIYQTLQEKIENISRENTTQRERVATLTQEQIGVDAKLATVSAELALATDERNGLRADRERLSTTVAQAQSKWDAEQRRAADLDARLSAVTSELSQVRAERDLLAKSKAELETQLTSDQTKFAEKLEFLEQAKETLTNQFQLLGNRIFEEKSERFGQLNQQQIAGLLIPLGEKLKDFETKVQTVYDSETQQRTALKTEIVKLVEANAKISEDANNLTRALKGESKAQGAWGEMVLERALEMSGLHRDREYRIQETFKDEEGARLRPDVIIDLPEKRHMVIDSKVSLTSYERFTTATDDVERQRELTQHVASVRSHMVSLGKRDYQHIYSLTTLDFVIMFVPIESAYSVVVQEDPMLTQDALAKNVLIVYPSTLLMALRTIAHVWRYEYQNKNAQEIARQAGALYDKFVGFVADLNDVGEKMGKAQLAFDAAHSKLSSGRGNLVGSTERLRKLGVKPKHALPIPLLEIALEGDDDESQSPSAEDAVTARQPLARNNDK